VKSKEILQHLQQKGYRATPQRRALINILSLTTRPITAQEICRKLQINFPGISIDTIYRNLRLLVELGLVGLIRAGTAHNDCFELLREHHYHLVCLDCGEITCLPGCPVASWEPPKQILGQFKVTGHSFELHGYCTRCQEYSRNKNKVG
jgi:Fe2+ or Zn2+ uptake regulation protein